MSRTKTLREQLKKVSPNVVCEVMIREMRYNGMPRTLLVNLPESDLNLDVQCMVHTLFTNGDRENKIYTMKKENT